MHSHPRTPLRVRSTLAAVVLMATAVLGVAACSNLGGGIGLTDGTAQQAPGSEVGSLTAADGYISVDNPVSIFDDTLPAISNLDPDLRAAVVCSSDLSAAYQEALLGDAVASYGSYDEARKWVSTPELSLHVTGEAVDVGPLDAQFWLMEHGYEFGLCQTFSNERWHFELVTAPGEMCPEMRSDAAE
mgnify:CR=1 FL=1